MYIYCCIIDIVSTIILKHFTIYMHICKESKIEIYKKDVIWWIIIDQIILWTTETKKLAEGRMNHV